MSKSQSYPTALFNVTFDIVTEESAAEGDVAESGFVSKDSGLRDAMHDVFAIGANVTAIECDSSPALAPCWITVYGGMNMYSGEYESRSLHLPESLTPSSRRRVARLMGAYGFQK